MKAQLEAWKEWKKIEDKGAKLKILRHVENRQADPIHKLTSCLCHKMLLVMIMTQGTRQQQVGGAEEQYRIATGNLIYQIQ